MRDSCPVRQLWRQIRKHAPRLHIIFHSDGVHCRQLSRPICKSWYMRRSFASPLSNVIKLHRNIEKLEGKQAPLTWCSTVITPPKSSSAYGDTTVQSRTNTRVVRTCTTADTNQLSYARFKNDRNRQCSKGWVCGKQPIHQLRKEPCSRLRGGPSTYAHLASHSTSRK